ncbi:MAG: VCBS repeat-containing protein, partial [Planctomycetes bacterium]|nr:VCBS repeat-containing protein [Planctomycetota bacterium]
DGNGILDAFVALSWGYLGAISTADGSFLWSVRLGSGELLSPPSAADLDGDGRIEVVQPDGAGVVWILDGATGRVLDRFETGGVPESIAATLADLDGDGALEILVPDSNRKLLVYDPRRRELLARVETGLASAPAVAVLDIEGDGRPECVLAGGSRVLVLDAHGLAGAAAGGMPSPRWSVELPGWVSGGVAAGDLDGDGATDVAVMLSREGKDKSEWAELHALDGRSGKPLWKEPPVFPSPSNGRPPALADADGDGKLDVVAVSRGGEVAAIRGADGVAIWTAKVGSAIPGSPATADLDGDGALDVHIAGEDGRVYSLFPRLDLLWWHAVARRVEGLVLVEVRGRESPDPIVQDLVGELARLDARTGEPVWTVEEPGSGFYHIASTTRDLDGDGTGDFWRLAGARVEARSGATGDLRWERVYGAARRLEDRPADRSGDGVPDPAAIVEENGTERVTCLSGADGRTLWEAVLPPTGGWDSWMRGRWPVGGDLDGDGVADAVVALHAGTLLAFSGRDGRELWRREGLGTLDVTPGIGDVDLDGRLDVAVASGSAEGALLSFFRGADGKPFERQIVLPRHARGEPLFANFSPGPGHLLLVPHEAGCLAFSLPGLSVAWDYRTDGSEGQPWPAHGFLARVGQEGDPHVLLGTMDGRAILLDARDGSPVWTFWTQGAVSKDPLAADLDGDGVAEVLVPSEDGKLRAVRPRLAPFRNDPEAALARLLAALILEETRSPNFVLAAAERYRRAASEDAWYHYARGFAEGPGLDPIAALGRSLDLAPGNARARTQRGRLLAIAGRLDEAIADLDLALGPGAELEEGYFFRGAARATKGDFAGAILDYGRVIELGAYPLRSFYGRGLALAEMGKLREALDDLDRAILLKPRGAPELRRQRARVRELAGDREGAIADCEAILDEEPEGPWAKEARQTIERLDREGGR